MVVLGTRLHELAARPVKAASWLRSERGQALTEFALTLPILLILVIGIIEFGRGWNAHQVITHAAREGCRRAVVFDPTVTEADVEAVIQAAIASAHFDPAAAVISFDGFKAGSGTVATCRVVLPYQFRFLKPFVQALTTSADGTLQLTTETRMRNE
jgi:Flp pilus assembly protein TadG